MFLCTSSQGPAKGVATPRDGWKASMAVNRETLSHLGKEAMRSSRNYLTWELKAQGMALILSCSDLDQIT